MAKAQAVVAELVLVVFSLSMIIELVFGFFSYAKLLVTVVSELDSPILFSTFILSGSHDEFALGLTTVDNCTVLHWSCMVSGIGVVSLSVPA